MKLCLACLSIVVSSCVAFVQPAFRRVSREQGREATRLDATSSRRFFGAQLAAGASLLLPLSASAITKEQAAFATATYGTTPDLSMSEEEFKSRFSAGKNLNKSDLQSIGSLESKLLNGGAFTSQMTVVDEETGETTSISRTKAPEKKASGPIEINSVAQARREGIKLCKESKYGDRLGGASKCTSKVMLNDWSVFEVKKQVDSEKKKFMGVF